MGFTGDSWVDIAAPLDVVYAIVADFDRLPEWQPDVTILACEELDGEGRPARVHTELKTAVRKVRSRLRVHYTPTSVRWTLEEGDVKAFDGGWTLEEVGPATTRATYEVTIDFGRKMGMLVRGPAGAKIANSAVSSMPGKLKAFVEGTREPESVG